MLKHPKRSPKHGKGWGKDSEEREMGVWWLESLWELCLAEVPWPGQSDAALPSRLGAASSWGRCLWVHTDTRAQACNPPSEPAPPWLAKVPLHPVSKANVGVPRPGL